MTISTGPVAFTVSGLTKRFDEVTAVNDISFEVNQGELFGFLGPNGAGKTTTINVLTGLARLDSGKVNIGEIDCTRNPELTGFDNLCFCAALYGIGKVERTKRARELLEIFNLADAADRKFQGYSKGMKRKLTLAAGIIHNPPILFLDEPTTGIDVASARQVRQIMADLHKQGTTVFLTTHYIEEAERLCERIAFIVNGKIVRIDRTENLLKPVQGKNMLLLSASDSGEDHLSALASEFPSYTFDSIYKGQIRVQSEETIVIGPLVRILEERGIQVTEARRHRPSLEDIFVEVTGIEAGFMQKDKEGPMGGGNKNR
jgi:ABC-2 type transport system ATP-binding protein